MTLLQIASGMVQEEAPVGSWHEAVRPGRSKAKCCGEEASSLCLCRVGHIVATAGLMHRAGEVRICARKETICLTSANSPEGQFHYAVMSNVRYSSLCCFRSEGVRPFFSKSVLFCC